MEYFLGHANISTKRRWIWSRRSLETIDISSIIITFNSDNLFLNKDLILSLKGGRFLPKQLTGILRPVWIVVPPIFMAETPVGAKRRTFSFSNSEFRYENIFVNDWYNTLVKNDFPHPALPVRNI